MVFSAEELCEFFEAHVHWDILETVLSDNMRFPDLEEVEILITVYIDDDPVDDNNGKEGDEYDDDEEERSSPQWPKVHEQVARFSSFLPSLPVTVHVSVISQPSQSCQNFAVGHPAPSPASRRVMGVAS
ncbi:hypothetical protein CC2G_012156 [Coprinopsis cinerea AmutBmut pab1-1]|nr:hypothetical protein CC2G_012156 [Coprinopsis cinerea AmutBmut pab1-1]